MNEAAFWSLVSQIDVAALDAGDEEGAVRPLERALAGLSEDEIEAFAELLARHLYDIDGQSYADNAGESAGSDDGFLYARCYVVAKGRDYYQTVKGDPTQMPKSLDQWCESLLYAHRYAWARLTRRDIDDCPIEPSISYETGSNRALWSN